MAPKAHHPVPSGFLLLPAVGKCLRRAVRLVATYASTLNGIVEKDKKEIDFVLIAYALDATEKAVYILKAVGNKVLVDKDTISVENLVFHIYTEPETDNPVTDTAAFTIPPTGAFPPVHEYRIN